MLYKMKITGINNSKKKLIVRFKLVDEITD